MNIYYTLSSHINVGMQKTCTLFEMAELIQSRIHKLFGYLPPISKTEKSSDNNHLTLDYKIDTLLSLCYKFQYSIEEEIDELIKYCFKDS
jgi:nucleoside-diphosphate-sugar epimerase